MIVSGRDSAKKKNLLLLDSILAVLICFDLLLLKGLYIPMKKKHNLVSSPEKLLFHRLDPPVETHQWLLVQRASEVLPGVISGWQTLLTIVRAPKVKPRSIGGLIYSLFFVFFCFCRQSFLQQRPYDAMHVCSLLIQRRKLSDTSKKQRQTAPRAPIEINMPILIVNLWCHSAHAYMDVIRYNLTKFKASFALWHKPWHVEDLSAEHDGLTGTTWEIDHLRFWFGIRAKLEGSCATCVASCVHNVFVGNVGLLRRCQGWLLQLGRSEMPLMGGTRGAKNEGEITGRSASLCEVDKFLRICVPRCRGDMLGKRTLGTFASFGFTWEKIRWWSLLSPPPHSVCELTWTLQND